MSLPSLVPLEPWRDPSWKQRSHKSDAFSGGGFVCRFITKLDEILAKARAAGSVLRNSRSTSLPWEAEFQILVCVQPASPNNEALGTF